MSDAQSRQLAIKTGAVRRLSKELGMYERERQQEAARVEKMKAAGADSHDIKHAEDVLAEASMMIPDNRQRLTATLQELIELKKKTEPTMADTEEWEKANAVILEAQKVLAV